MRLLGYAVLRLLGYAVLRFYGFKVIGLFGRAVFIPYNRTTVKPHNRKTAQPHNRTPFPHAKLLHFPVFCTAYVSKFCILLQPVDFQRITHTVLKGCLLASKRLPFSMPFAAF